MLGKVSIAEDEAGSGRGRVQHLDLPNLPALQLSHDQSLVKDRHALDVQESRPQLLLAPRGPVHLVQALTQTVGKGHKRLVFVSLLGFDTGKGDFLEWHTLSLLRLHC